MVAALSQAYAHTETFNGPAFNNPRLDPHQPIADFSRDHCTPSNGKTSNFQTNPTRVYGEVIPGV